MKQSLTLFLSMLLVCLLLSACGDVEEPFAPKPVSAMIGDWTCVYAQTGGETQTAEDWSLAYRLILEPDNNARFTIEGTVMPGKWEETEAGGILSCYSKQYVLQLEETGLLSMEFGPYMLTFAAEGMPWRLPDSVSDSAVQPL